LARRVLDDVAAVNLFGGPRRAKSSRHQGEGVLPLSPRAAINGLMSALEHFPASGQSSRHVRKVPVTDMGYARADLVVGTDAGL
jgi:hypothetical protein